MKKPTPPEDKALWGLVKATVRPLRSTAPAPFLEPPLWKAGAELKPAPPPAPRGPLEEIEPGRRRRLSRERDLLELRLDMHGMTQDRARAALEAFIRRAFMDDHRAVLVITGKGAAGGGVLRRSAPGWLAAPAMREMVAGVSPAHARHGGEGAIYVALKRRLRA